MNESKLNTQRTQYFRGYYPLDYNIGADGNKEFFVASVDPYYRPHFTRIKASEVPQRIRKQMHQMIEHGYVKMWAYWPVDNSWSTR